MSERSNSINHISFIMDGNRRWAKKSSTTNLEAYKKGVENLMEKVNFCIDKKIPYCSFFALSQDNLKRSEDEIESLFVAIKMIYEVNRSKIIKNSDKFQLRIIGNLDLLPSSMKKFLKEMESEINLKEKPPGFTTVIICVAYASREEITDGFKNAMLNIVEECKTELSTHNMLGLSVFDDDLDADQKFDELLKEKLNSINSSNISNHFYTPDCPDPDILIRTGGETRLSNFMLWQCRYTEIVFFKEAFWPEFSNEQLEIILDNYKKTVKNFGK